MMCLAVAEFVAIQFSKNILQKQSILYTKCSFTIYFSIIKVILNIYLSREFMISFEFCQQHTMGKRRFAPDCGRLRESSLKRNTAKEVVHPVPLLWRTGFFVWTT
jgi:hypothetical protein